MPVIRDAGACARRRRGASPGGSPAAGARRSSDRVRHGPARTDEAQQVIDSHIFHGEKTNLAFYVDYAVAQATKLIGRGFRTSKAAIQKLRDAHGVRDPKNHFKRLKQRVVATGLLRRPEREDKGTSIIANDPDIQGSGELVLVYSFRMEVCL